MFNFLKFIIITVSTKRKLIDKSESYLINKHTKYNLQLYKKLNRTEFTSNKQECNLKEIKGYNDEDLLGRNQDLNDFSSLLENRIQEDTNLNENLLSDILDNEEIDDKNIRALYSDNKLYLSSDHSEEYSEIEKEDQNLIELPKIEIKEKESFLNDLLVESNITFFENNI